MAYHSIHSQLPQYTTHLAVGRGAVGAAADGVLPERKGNGRVQVLITHSPLIASRICSAAASTAKRVASLVVVT